MTNIMLSVKLLGGWLFIILPVIRQIKMFIYLFKKLVVIIKSTIFVILIIINNYLFIGCEGGIILGIGVSCRIILMK
jgi:hypothetical protein